MSAENIDRIIELYTKRTDVEKESHLASYEEIKANDFNLNIPRYVDTFEEEEEISLADISSELLEESKEIKTLQEDFLKQFAELTSDDENVMNELSLLMKTLQDIG